MLSLPQEVSELDGVALVAGVNSKLMLADYLTAGWPKATMSRGARSKRHYRVYALVLPWRPATRYFLKVQDGCDYWCTYAQFPRPEAARAQALSHR